MKKIVFSLIFILIMSFCCGLIKGYATTDIENITEAMKDTSQFVDNAGSSKIVGGINSIIGLIQIVGTGISLIVVTMLGIKYIIASPSEKADTKKQIMPILIGCVLLFGACNLMGIVASFAGIMGSKQS